MWVWGVLDFGWRELEVDQNIDISKAASLSECEDNVKFLIVLLYSI